MQVSSVSRQVNRGMLKLYLIIGGLFLVIVGGLLGAFNIELKKHEADLQKIEAMKSEIANYKTTLDTLRNDAAALKANQDALYKSMSDVRVNAEKQKNKLRSQSFNGKDPTALQQRINEQTQKALRDLEAVSNP